MASELNGMLKGRKQVYLKNKIYLGILASILSSILYGLSFLFTKSVSAEHSLLTLLGWRFFAAFSVMSGLLLFGLIRTDFRKKGIRPLMRLSLLFPLIYFVCENLGVKLTTASESGVIISSIPVVTVLMARIMLKEAVSRWQLAGILVSTLGIIAIVLSKSAAASLNLWGYAALFAAVSTYSLFAILLIRAKAYTVTEVTYFMLAVAALFFFTAALAEHHFQGTLSTFLRLPFTQPKFLAAVAYLSIGSSVMAFFASNTAIKLLGASRSASFAGLSTLVTVLSSVFFLGEHFTLQQALASILVLAGVYLANAK